MARIKMSTSPWAHFSTGVPRVLEAGEVPASPLSLHIVRVFLAGAGIQQQHVLLRPDPALM